MGDKSVLRVKSGPPVANTSGRFMMEEAAIIVKLMR